MLEHPDDAIARSPELRSRRFAHTAAGTVVVAALLGIRDALEREETEAPVVEDWAGEPLGDDELLIRLDPDNPADSIVLVRAPRYVREV